MILFTLQYVTVRYVLNRFFPSFMEYLTPWLIDLARLATRNVIWELETATQLTLWYPTYISTGDLCLNTNSLPFFRRRKVGFEVPALQEDNQHRFITKFSLNDLDFYTIQWVSPLTRSPVVNHISWNTSIAKQRLSILWITVSCSPSYLPWDITPKAVQWFQSLLMHNVVQLCLTADNILLLAIALAWKWQFPEDIYKKSNSVTEW